MTHLVTVAWELILRTNAMRDVTWVLVATADVVSVFALITLRLARTQH